MRQVYRYGGSPLTILTNSCRFFRDPSPSVFYCSLFLHLPYPVERKNSCTGLMYLCTKCIVPATVRIGCVIANRVLLGTINERLLFSHSISGVFAQKVTDLEHFSWHIMLDMFKKHQKTASFLPYLHWFLRLMVSDVVNCARILRESPSIYVSIFTETFSPSRSSY